jgi:hypothetical protein
MIVAGYYYFTTARNYCEHVRAQAQQTNPRWRRILYPSWFWGTNLCVVQLQSSGIGLILVGLILLVVAGLGIFYRHS